MSTVGFRSTSTPEEVHTATGRSGRSYGFLGGDLSPDEHPRWLHVFDDATVAEIRSEVARLPGYDPTDVDEEAHGI